jgi:hypothetical protein
VAVSASQVAVSTTATLLSARETDNISGQSVAILSCPVDLYLGPEGVTSSTGAKLPSGTPLGVDLMPGESLYAATASGSTTAHVLRTGV